MPALAGTARMPYRRFLAYNAAGGLVWGVAVVLAGYVAGASYAKVEATMGKGGTLGNLALTVAVFAVHAVRELRERSRSSPWSR